jgi:alanine dehydrogenase
MKTRLLSRADIQGFLTMKIAIDAVENAFRDLANGQAVMPQRTPIPVPDHKGIALFMPAHIKSMGAIGAKVVTVYKENMIKHKIPVTLGTIILLDESTGFPVCIMDGGFLTAMRTGAVTGVSCKYMAREDSKVMTIFGTGVQAFTQVLAVHEARPLKKVLAYSIDPPEMKADFAKKITEAIGVPVEQVDDPAKAVGRSDIVVLATSASEPIVDGDWFAPGTHISGIGSHSPGARELDSKTINRARVIGDLIDACKAESGDFIIPVQNGEWSWDRMAGSLGDVVTGKVKGRTSRDEITLFKSNGLAIQDMSTARAVYDEAVKKGIGVEFQF